MWGVIAGRGGDKEPRGLNGADGELAVRGEEPRSGVSPAPLPLFFIPKLHVDLCCIASGLYALTFPAR